MPAATVNEFIADKNDPEAVGEPLVLRVRQVEGFPDLKHVEKEARAISDLYGVRPLIGADALESRFRKEADDAGILHLASHATFNRINPLFSRIYLTPDDKNDGALEIHEIYGLDLPKANLVVLSACNTQKGSLTKGDEFMSLNRAFMRAGASSVIVSLLSVGDRTTTELMKHFYRKLRGGMRKSEALRRAQLRVYRNHSSPYYWAPLRIDRGV